MAEELAHQIHKLGKHLTNGKLCVKLYTVD